MTANSVDDATHPRKYPPPPPPPPPPLKRVTPDVSLTRSSRDSSPVAKRQRRSFSPTSNDGDIVVPVAPNQDAQTPTPLIRQALGFSWTPSINANVTTYQATVAPQPIVPYFLPGQAPPPPPKPKNMKPKAPRRKKGEQFSGQTIKFKLGDSTSSSSPPSGSACLTPTSTRFCSMIPAAMYHAGATTSDALPPGPKRTKKPSKKRPPATVSQSNSQPSPAGPSQSLLETSGQADPQRTHVASATATTQGPALPMRMVTLLIEDLRSGVPDSQLAEVKVPLKVADDPEDGFWADAVEICSALQGGPSRIDGPAKVYTMRGRFRQFFMRVDQLDEFEVQSAHLGVSKERTLSVFVEAPVPQGQLPRPPEMRPVHNSGSEREVTTSPSTRYSRPTYSLVTREDQIERLSKSNYVRADRRLTPVSESGSYGHSRRTTPSRSLRRNQFIGQRPLTPPIPGRLADTQDEKDEAIANYIRSHVENHPGWMDYMQSKAKYQRVSEVLKQYTFVEDRVRELIGRKTPPHWDGAPSCYVEKQHIWRVLKLDAAWGEECEETMALVRFYGQNGLRYEDSRVIDMINDTSPPKANTIDAFLCFLRGVDERFTLDALSGQFMPAEN